MARHQHLTHNKCLAHFFIVLPRCPPPLPLLSLSPFSHPLSSDECEVSRDWCFPPPVTCPALYHQALTKYYRSSLSSILLFLPLLFMEQKGSTNMHSFPRVVGRFSLTHELPSLVKRRVCAVRSRVTMAPPLWYVPTPVPPLLSRIGYMTHGRTTRVSNK